MQLYTLVNQYLQLSEMAEELDSQTFLDTLETIQDSIEEKCENIAKMVRNIEGDTNALKEEESRLASRRRTLESKVNSLKSYLQNQLEITGISKVKRPMFTISIQKNPPSVAIENEDIVPIEYQVQQAPKIDRKAILQALTSGFEIEGCSIKQGQSLRIK